MSRAPRLLPKKNNFDLLRLLMATVVCLVHASQLSGYPQLAWIPMVLSSEVAVKAFFVISGFLIVMSLERSASLAGYARKRMRRIYPGYLVVIVASAFGLWGVSTAGASDYFSAQWLRYLAANLVFLNFLQPVLPGVFENNSLMAVNGALWTLKIEVLFYLTVPVLVGLVRRFSPLPVLVLVYLLSVAWTGLLGLLANKTGLALYLELARQLPGQLTYFMAGTFFYYFLPLLHRHWPRFLAGAVAVLALDHVYALPLLEPFALGSLVMCAALFFPVLNAGKYGDFSYGVYIVHFPIIQLLLDGGWFRHDAGLFLLTVLVLTATGAFALWHLVEKHFLRGTHYKAATPG